MPIKVLLTGATGMVGQGVLIECLESPDVASVVVLARRSCGVTHPKLIELIHLNFLDLSKVESAFNGCNACFWCLGVSSMGMNEADYTHITVDYSLKTAEVLARLCPDLTFCYVSGEGTDSTESSKTMWARVKGRGENSLKNFQFKRLYFFRPAYIRPMKGVKPSWPIMYKLTGFLYPVLKALMPKYVSTTEQVGRAMINAALKGYDKQILDSRDIVRLAH